MSEQKVLDKFNAIFSRREDSHGDYADIARVSQALKRAVRSGGSWMGMDDVAKESLDLKCTKMARICCGEAEFEDHWLDDAGYTILKLARML